jgi:hypothetical protein
VGHSIPLLCAHVARGAPRRARVLMRPCASDPERHAIGREAEPSASATSCDPSATQRRALVRRTRSIRGMTRVMAGPRQSDPRHVASGSDPFSDGRASRAEQNVARVEATKSAIS